VIPELESAVTEIERTIEILRKSSCDRWMVQLEQLLAEVRGLDRYAQKEALFHVGEFCNPKSLGDALVTSTDSHTWQTQLERLHDTCARAFNTLERATT
jgi:hypothetical protein